MHNSVELKKKFDSFLANYPFTGRAKSLYAPVEYIMSLGGKRIRPILVMMGCELFEGHFESALKAALALEVFHNFTLVHDDIMDKADTRRGKETVHIKYDENLAILSGDVMLIKSYDLLGEYEDPKLQVSLYKIFNKLSIELCEGQQFDMEFETRDDVTVDEYIEMVTMKTGVLIAGALKMGALIGRANEKDAEHLYEFGKNIGIAFQLQDDLLDTFGTYEKVGKKIGGDIVQNKKTYLYLKALELASELERKELIAIYKDQIPIEEIEKIKKVTKLFDRLVVAEYARQVRDAYLDLAYAHLGAVKIADKRKINLHELAGQLVNRDF